MNESSAAAAALAERVHGQDSWLDALDVDIVVDESEGGVRWTAYFFIGVSNKVE